jgi:hypothetical protein
VQIVEPEVQLLLVLVFPLDRGRRIAEKRIENFVSVRHSGLSVTV